MARPIPQKKPCYSCGNIPPDLLALVTKRANWALDKYAKDSTEVQGELL